MVGRKQRRRESGLAGSHQRSWLWGRHAVLEALRAGRWLPLEVHAAFADAADPFWEETLRLCDEHDCSVIEASAERLTALCRSGEHQGLLAKMPAYPYAALGDLREKLRTSAGPAFILLLDCIQDPFNFGAILRSAEIFGAQAVIVPEHGQADVSLHVARSSAGAVNYLDIVRVKTLVDAAEQFRSLGITLYGASEKGTLAPANADLSSPTALVIGNEGTGLSSELAAKCDQLISIPQSGHVSSLNAAVAAGILCYEVRRQRG